MFNFQVIFPTVLYPSFLIDLHSKYCSLFNDSFCFPDLWYQGIQFTRFIATLPLIILVKDLYTGNKRFFPAILYSVASFSLISPVLFDIILSHKKHKIWLISLNLIEIGMLSLLLKYAYNHTKFTFKRLSQPEVIIRKE